MSIGLVSTTLADLTPREREVIELIAEGCSNQAICEILDLSLGAVEKYTGNLYAKILPTPVPATQNARVCAVLWFREQTAPSDA